MCQHVVSRWCLSENEVDRNMSIDTVAVAQRQEGGLFEALVADGFSGYCVGPKHNPAALICVYEWPEHFDVIVVPSGGGHAAAARLAKPADVFDPPDTAVWAWVGPPDLAIWAMLDLPHPDHAAAPAAALDTPTQLRALRKGQRPLIIRVPDEQRRGHRAVRLSRMQTRAISEQFFNDLLDEVDSESAVGFALNFTEDGTFQWGNFPPVVGREAIREFTDGFFAMVSSVRHQLDHYWRVGVEEPIAMTNGRVTFTRLDGEVVTVPFSTVCHFTPDGTKMTYYQVYLDPSALMQS